MKTRPWQFVCDLKGCTSVGPALGLRLLPKDLVTITFSHCGSFVVSRTSIRSCFRETFLELSPDLLRIPLVGTDCTDLNGSASFASVTCFSETVTCSKKPRLNLRLVASFDRL